MNLTLRQYLKNNDMNVSEGSLHNQKDQQNLLRKLIKGCRKGMQIGFNAGDSADLFLDETGGILTSFDINRHNYVAVGNKYMNLKYPKKHTLIKGDSTIVLPKQKTKKYEYIYIDGGHTFTVADQDIKNCKRFSTPKTFFIFWQSAILNSSIPLSVYPRFSGFSASSCKDLTTPESAISSGSPTPRSNNSLPGLASRAARLALFIFSNL